MKPIQKFCHLIVICIPSLSWGETSHELGMSLLQQNQSFQLNNQEINLRTYTPELHYQLMFNQWQLGVSSAISDSHANHYPSDSASKYQITSDQESHSIYLDYNFSQSWLSLSVNDTNNQYRHLSNDNSIRNFVRNELDSQTWNMDFGYAWLFDDGQFIVSLGTSYQESDESFQLVQTQVNTLGSVYDQDHLTQSGWLGNISGQYQHYFSFEDNISVMLGMGLSHSQSIQGDAYLLKTSQTQLAGTRLASSKDEYFIESDSDTTSVIMQTGILLQAGTINLSLDKLTSEPWSDALLELGFSLYF